MNGNLGIKIEKISKEKKCLDEKSFLNENRDSNKSFFSNYAGQRDTIFTAPPGWPTETAQRILKRSSV